MKKINLILVLCLSSCLGFAQIILTVAGGPNYGFSGDGGFAVNAKLNAPNGVAADIYGNIYIADTYNYRIRKVSSTGIITTIGGNGSYGFSGDNGPATSAKFWTPVAVAVDASGNIYIADRDNNRIRKITASTGIITTIAGTGTPPNNWGYNGDGIAATSATLTHPTGVAVDASGNVYIADNDVCRIRKITASTGIISTVAGSGVCGPPPGGYGDGGPATSALLQYPHDVAVDASGNLYIADEYNHKIRKVTASTGIITSLAGTGTSGFSGDNGLATVAMLNNPVSVTVDASGNVYFADPNASRVRKINSSGIITTVTGNGTHGYNGDGILASSAQLYDPIGVAVNTSNGNLYIVDAGNINGIQKDRIRLVTSSCPAIAGPNKTNNQDCCTYSWPGVQIGGPSVPNMTYSWSPNTNLSSTSIAQPISTWQTVGTPKVYTVTVSNANCASATSQVTVTAIAAGYNSCCGRIGMNSIDLTEERKINISPNPTNGIITIEVKEEIQSIVITDITGRIMYNVNNVVSGSYSVDLSKDPKGIYLVKVIGDGIERVEKVILQ